MNETDMPRSGRATGRISPRPVARGLSRLVLVEVEELGAVVGAEREREAREVGAQLVNVVALGADEAAQ